MNRVLALRSGFEPLAQGFGSDIHESDARFVHVNGYRQNFRSQSARFASLRSSTLRRDTQKLNVQPAGYYGYAHRRAQDHTGNAQSWNPRPGIKVNDLVGTDDQSVSMGSMKGSNPIGVKPTSSLAREKLSEQYLKYQERIKALTKPRVDIVDTGEVVHQAAEKVSTWRILVSTPSIWYVHIPSPTHDLYLLKPFTGDLLHLSFSVQFSQPSGSFTLHLGWILSLQTRSDTSNYLKTLL